MANDTNSTGIILRTIHREWCERRARWRSQQLVIITTVFRTGSRKPLGEFIIPNEVIVREAFLIVVKECQPLGTSPDHVELKESEKAPSFHGTLVTGSEPSPPVPHDEGLWMESEQAQSYPRQRHDGPVTGSVHAPPVSHLWNGPSGTAPSQSTHSYGCEPEMDYGTGKTSLLDS